MKQSKVIYTNRAHPSWQSHTILFIAGIIFLLMIIVPMIIYTSIIEILSNPSVLSWSLILRFVCGSIAIFYPLFFLSMHIKGIEIHEDGIYVWWRKYPFSNIDCVFVEKHKQTYEDKRTRTHEIIVIKYIAPIGKKKYATFPKNFINDFDGFLSALKTKVEVKQDMGVVKEDLGLKGWRVEFPPPSEEYEVEEKQ